MTLTRYLMSVIWCQFFDVWQLHNVTMCWQLCQIHIVSSLYDVIIFIIIFRSISQHELIKKCKVHTFVAVSHLSYNFISKLWDQRPRTDLVETSLSWFLVCRAALRWQIAATLWLDTDRRDYFAIRQTQRFQFIRTTVYQIGCCSSSHWQPKKITQHRLNISECQWWTMTPHSRHFAIESTVAVVKLTSHERLCQHLGSVCGQRTSDGPQLPQLEEAWVEHCHHRSFSWLSRWTPRSDPWLRTKCWQTTSGCKLLMQYAGEHLMAKRLYAILKYV